MEKDNNVKVLAISDLCHAFSWHIIPIILAAVISVLGVYIYSRYFRKPLYRSTAALYILRQEREPNYDNSNLDFSLALNVVNDCNYMLKSHAVLDDVMEELNLNIAYKSLASMISTYNPDGTRVLEVSVESESMSLSKDIVDTLCRIGADKISEAMGFNQVNVYEYGTVTNIPSNQIGLRRYALIGIGAVVLVYLAYLLAMILDDKIRSEEDVHKYLNLSVLGDIPNASAAEGSKYSRYYRYDRKHKYGKYYRYGEKNDNLNNAPQVLTEDQTKQMSKNGPEGENQ